MDYNSDSKMKTLLMYVRRGLEYLVWAGFFAFITYSYWIMSGGNVFSAYMSHVIGISIALIADKIRLSRLHKKKKGKKDYTSLRPSLYIFHILALVFSQMLTLGAPIEVSENISGYLQSVSYGIILLFAIDTLFVHLINDDKRVRKFTESQQESNDSD